MKKDIVKTADGMQIDLNAYEYAEFEESGANLSRVKQHLNKDNVAFISAFRDEYSKKDNIVRNKRLALDIHNMGLGYIRLKGGYVEGDTNKVLEDSFMVINPTRDKKKQDDFFQEMLGLCTKYDQDSVLISLLDREDIPRATYDRKGILIAGPFMKGITLQNITNYFSRIHGHTFKLESCNYTESISVNKPHSMLSAMTYYGTKEEMKKYSKK